MLGDLVRGREKSSLTLIEDTAYEPGRGILACFLCSLSQRVAEVHVFTLDTKSLCDSIPEGIQKKIIIHDGQRDFLNWKELTTLNLESDFVKEIKTHGNLHGDKTIAVVVDSLSPLLLFRPVPYTCQTLQRLSDSAAIGATVEQVVALVHQDLHDNGSLSLVEHIATSVIKTSPSQSARYQFSCNTLHKKISGKIVRVTEHFNITEQFEVCDITELKNVLEITPQQTDTQPDPTANLTFNLSLTDREKTARSQVKLPYTYDQERKDATLNKSVGEGKIFYQPDEADDFDEEDPDDDLDI